MEIAATGLLLPLMGPGRDRPQSTPTESTRDRGNQRETANRGQTPEPADNGRVIRGEVLSSQIDSSRAIGGLQRSNESNSSSFASADTRRFSLQAAIQTFRDNEALITDPANPRQVSGIIDEYV